MDLFATEGTFTFTVYFYLHKSINNNIKCHFSGLESLNINIYLSPASPFDSDNVQAFGFEKQRTFIITPYFSASPWFSFPFQIAKGIIRIN